MCTNYIYFVYHFNASAEKFLFQIVIARNLYNKTLYAVFPLFVKLASLNKSHVKMADDKCIFQYFVSFRCHLVVPASSISFYSLWREDEMLR